MRRGILGRVRRVTAAAVSCALLAQLITVAPAVAAPAPREIVEQRTAYSRVFDNGDGTFKFESHAGPIHYKDETTGRFEPIDNDLVRSTDPAKRGWRNKANGFKVTLPERVGADWVSIEAGSKRVSFRPARSLIVLDPAASASATGVPDPVNHDKLTYASSFGPGVSLEYVSSATGIKETIVLDKYRGKNTFTFDLETGGLSPRMTPDGGIILTSSESTAPVYTIAPPFMEDSAANDGDEPARSDNVTYVLMPAGDGWRLTVVADESWLTADKRVWPVRIDPTFFVAGFGASQDSFVTNAFPNTNYGSSGELKVGYYPGAGENYTYVMPDLSVLQYLDQYAAVQVLDAGLSMYCSWRYDHGTGPVCYGRANGPWSEPGITWNNQPYATYDYTGYVTEGQRSSLHLTALTQAWMDGAIPYQGLVLWSPGPGSVWHWTKFASRETGGPVFNCTFTTRPIALLNPPDLEVPACGGPAVSWSHTDLYYALNGVASTPKPQKRAELEVHRNGTAGSLYTQTVTGSATSATLQAPAGGWTPGRYSVRLRVITDVTGTGAESASDWTPWRPFEIRPLGERSDGAGLEAYRAVDSAAGASVDLATGRLLLSRTDFAAPGLGGQLGATFVYDSAVTADTGGAGTGWRVSMPALGFDDQKAPNPGFEAWSGAPSLPTGWVQAEAGAAVFQSLTDKRSGSSSMKVLRTSVGNMQVRTGEPIGVYPGQTLDAAAWVKTSALVAGSGGVQVRIGYYDEYGNYKGHAESSTFIEPSSSDWRQLSVRGVVPEGVTQAYMFVGLYNCYGTVYVDDVQFGDETLRLTDADGTTRTFTQLAGGVYQRDPLVGKLALRRTNVVRGVKPTSATQSAITGASTDGIYSFSGGTGYDAVTRNPDGSAWLQYDLGEARVLSEARIRFWDGAESAPRTYTYALKYSLDGTTWHDPEFLDGTTSPQTGRSWVTHFFSPVRARYVRIVALENTANIGFHVCEFELPVTTVSESPVAFDPNRRVTGIADTSGNLIRYTYDADGDLLSSADSQGRHLDLAWSGEQLAGLDWTGVGSESATPVSDAGVVSYARDGVDLLVKRRADNGTYVTMATYAYTDGRITSVTDADGITAEVSYENARVHTITRSSESTPTVTHYDYGVPHQVTITTSGGTESVSRRVEFSPALGYQVTAVVVDPGGENLRTEYAYDTYGHITSVTDPLGRVDTYTSDAHGNVTEATVNSTAGDPNLKLTATSTYMNDRVTSSADSKGNVSRQLYDAKWRPMSSTTSVSSSGAEATVEETYDSYGNRTQGDVPGSTAANLLENGTFEKDPSVAGNGWTVPADAGSRLSFSDTPAASRPIHQLKNLTASAGAPRWVTSDQVAVTAGESYQFSVWTRGAGTVRLTEINAAGAAIRTFDLARLSDRQSEELQRVSATYQVGAGVARVTLELRADGTSLAAFDNARFEKANAVGPDNLIDNDSFERLAGSAPEGWVSYGGAPLVLDAPVIAGGERALHIGAPSAASSPNWESVAMPVRAGEQFAFAVDLLCQNIALAADGSALVELTFFKDDACSWTTGNVLKETITDPTLLKGSTEWRRFSRSVTIPEGARQMKVRVILWHASGDLYADHLSMEPTAPRETYGHDASHTYRTETTQLTGAKVGAEYDSRGRATEVTHTNPNSASETVETERTYDSFDRLVRAETAPDSSLGIAAEFSYTDAGRLETVTDPLGEVTTVTYDEGRIASVESPSGVRTAITYDGLGRPKTTTAPYRGTETPRTLLEYVYDAVGRVSATTIYAEDGSVAATQTTTFDSLSRPDVVTWTGPEAQGSLDYTYDALGRTTGLTSTGPAGTVSFTAAFDKASLPLTSTFTAFGLPTFTTTNTFAKTGQWQKTSTANSQEWTFTFGTDGTFRRAASPLSSRGLLYNTALQLDRVRLATTSGLFTADEAITYDGYGRVAGSVLSATGDALDASQAFTYDAAGRLENWTLNGATTTYASDAAGNLTGIDRPGTGDDTTFTPGDDNQLASAVTAGVTTTYAYDDFGRRTHESSSAGETTYTYNSLGRLTGIESGDATSTYEYGPTGMRERAVVESANTTTTTECVWSGGTLVASRVSETQGGTTTVTDYRYLYGPDSLPLEMIVTPLGGTPSAYTFQCDRSGSVIALTDATGAAVATYAYDPWGAALEAPTTGVGAANPLRYRSYYFDDATGLYYLPARYYDPATARFLSPDPASPSAGDPLSLNAYAYCLGDPVNASDPSGAVMVQGSGVTGRVLPEAIDLAKKGHLDKAKVVQAHFRDELADLRSLERYDFEQTIGIAQLNAGAFAYQEYGGILYGDGTPFGRRNWDMRPTRPDDKTWGLCTVGVICDFGGVGGWVVSAFVDLWFAFGYYNPERKSGHATGGDVLFTAAAIIPGANTVETVIYGVYYDDIHWAEPFDQDR